MTVPIVVTVLVIVGFIAWAIQLSRRQSANKKAAIAELAEQQEQLAGFDIFALVDAEVAELQLKEIEGSSEIPASVLLKQWNQSSELVSNCPSRDMLRYVVRTGINPAEATDDDVDLVCDDLAGSMPVEPEPAAQTTAESVTVTEGAATDDEVRADEGEESA